MKKRLDILLVEKEIAESREKAQALILSGKVRVSGAPCTKAGTKFDESVDIRFKESGNPFVSRGGLKLDHALNEFYITTRDKVVMDIGASTGGFTDCVLQRGARKVYAVDVGYGQLAWRLRNDSRVSLMERTNARYLERERISDPVDLVVQDISFISITKVIPVIIDFLSEEGEIVSLIKPQFEVGKGEVGKGGIVRDAGKREEVINSIKGFMLKIGLKVCGTCQSPIRGQKGNMEYFIHLKK